MRSIRIILAGISLALFIVPVHAQWTMVWNDEFDSTTLNTNKWIAVNNCGDRRNGEQQCYMASAVGVSGGSLVLTGTNQAQSTFSYTSGAVKTGTKFTVAYGKIEFRAQMPSGGQGVWPALWLYPPNQWPPEIDVLEAINSMSTIYMGYHWGTSADHRSDGGNTIITNPTAWHTYGVEWDVGEIRWYIDGVLKNTYTGAAVTDIPMQLYINLALGGSWPGSVGPSTVFPQTMRVDYVRVYKRATEVHRPVKYARASVISDMRRTVYDLKGQRISAGNRKPAGTCAVLLSSDGSSIHIR
jgi:beta-glucanase (GH16 family)